jgi:type II secretory pathway component GspD/PulD (secretin)
MIIDRLLAALPITSSRAVRSAAAGRLALAARVAACLAALSAAHAHAEAPPWQTGRFEYSAASANIRDAFAELSQQGRVPIVVDPDVDARLAGRFNMTPQHFLDVATSDNGLDWYFDGTVVRVSRASARRTLAIRLDYAEPEALFTGLRETRIADPRFAPQLDEGARVVTVSGPPAFVTRVEQAARALERGARERVRTGVRVVKLSAARAADRNERQGERVIVLPGVATLMQQRARTARAQPLTPGIKPIEFETPLPIFEADATNNAVLVRDRPERLAADAAMIEAYDRRPTLVRLVAYVAEIDADALAALPLPWRAADVTQPAAARVAYTDDEGAQMVAQLHTFEQEGRARIELARDTTTVDGTPVTVDRYENRLVEAADRGVGEMTGERGETLLGVSTGIALNVTPLVEPAAGPSTPGDSAHVALKVRLTTNDAQGAGTASEASADVTPRRCAVIALPAAPSVPAAVAPSTGPVADSKPAREHIVLVVPYLSGNGV